MKPEKWLPLLGASLLSFAAGVAAAGCVLTAFDLPLEQPAIWILTAGICALAALICAHPRGDLLLMGGIALTGVWFWRRGLSLQPTLALIYRLCSIYDGAYDLGLMNQTSDFWSTVPADQPIAFLAAAVTIVVCRSLTRGRRTWPGVLACLLPFLTCIVVTDSVPDWTYLFLWLAVLVLQLLPSTVRREDPWQGLKLTAAAVLPVTLALLALSWFAPQNNYVNHFLGGKIIWNSMHTF